MFPPLYHAHHNQYTDDIPFWLDLAAQADGSVLELGCGTGRVLLPLANAGNQVYGLDNDRDMLRFLANRLTPVSQSLVHLIQADMSQFHFATAFGLIILPCNTLSALPPAALRAMLACVFNHLGSDGVFAASLPNPQLLAQMSKHGQEEVEDVFPHPTDGEPVQVSSAWERDEQFFSVSWYYDLLLPDGRVERMQTVVRHQLLPTSAYLEMLKDAGFHSIKLYGDFTKAPYRKRSPQLVVIASSGSSY
jgi:SAM-dependent methyltransferase